MCAIGKIKKKVVLWILESHFSISLISYYTLDLTFSGSEVINIWVWESIYTLEIPHILYGEFFLKIYPNLIFSWNSLIDLKIVMVLRALMSTFKTLLKHFWYLNFCQFVTQNHWNFAIFLFLHNHFFGFRWQKKRQNIKYPFNKVSDVPICPFFQEIKF